MHQLFLFIWHLLPPRRVTTIHGESCWLFYYTCNCPCTTVCRRGDTLSVSVPLASIWPLRGDGSWQRWYHRSWHTHTCSIQSNYFYLQNPPFFCQKIQLCVVLLLRLQGLRGVDVTCVVTVGLYPRRFRLACEMAFLSLSLRSTVKHFPTHKRTPAQSTQRQ